MFQFFALRVISSSLLLQSLYLEILCPGLIKNLNQKWLKIYKCSEFYKGQAVYKKNIKDNMDQLVKILTASEKNIGWYSRKIVEFLKPY